MLVAWGGWHVQFCLFRTNGLLWSLAGFDARALIDRPLPGTRTRRHSSAIQPSYAQIIIDGFTAERVAAGPRRRMAVTQCLSARASAERCSSGARWAGCDRPGPVHVVKPSRTWNWNERLLSIFRRPRVGTRPIGRRFLRFYVCKPRSCSTAHRSRARARRRSPCSRWPTTSGPQESPSSSWCRRHRAIRFTSAEGADRSSRRASAPRLVDTRRRPVRAARLRSLMAMAALPRQRLRSAPHPAEQPRRDDRGAHRRRHDIVILSATQTPGR